MGYGHIGIHWQHYKEARGLGIGRPESGLREVGNNPIFKKLIINNL